MATQWDRIQKQRDENYRRILSEVRKDPLMTLNDELEIALHRDDQAHIYAIKDVSIMLFLEAQAGLKDLQIQYADIFDTLQKRSAERAGKKPGHKYHNFAGFFEALYGSLIVMSSLVPTQADLIFIARSESHREALELLSERRFISASWLGKHLSLTTQRGSQILSGLKTRGLIRLIEKVGRMRLYCLTQAGTVLVQYVQQKKDI